MRRGRSLAPLMAAAAAVSAVVAIALLFAAASADSHRLETVRRRTAEAILRHHHGSVRLAPATPLRATVAADDAGDLAAAASSEYVSDLREEFEDELDGLDSNSVFCRLGVAKPNACRPLNASATSPSSAGASSDSGHSHAIAADIARVA